MLKSLRIPAANTAFVVVEGLEKLYEASQLDHMALSWMTYGSTLPCDWCIYSTEPQLGRTAMAVRGRQTEDEQIRSRLEKRGRVQGRERGVVWGENGIAKREGRRWEQRGGVTWNEQVTKGTCGEDSSMVHPSGRSLGPLACTPRGRGCRSESTWDCSDSECKVKSCAFWLYLCLNQLILAGFNDIFYQYDVMRSKMKTVA